MLDVVDDVLSIRAERLLMEGRDVTQLADEFGTPLYVISESKLRANVRRFQGAFDAAWPHGPVDILASFKANHALALRMILTEEGAGCDCFGSSELHGAITCRVDPSRISLNGSFKDEATLRRGIAHGARITLDSADEFDLVERIAAELGTVAKVRLRLRPFLSRISAHSDLRDEFPLGMALHVGKYGIPQEDVVPVGRRALASPFIELTGLHFHGGRHSLDPAVWREIGDGVGEEIAAVCSDLDGYQPREIDCGGGFPNPRDAVRRGLAEERDRPAPPPVEDFANALTEGLSGRLQASGMKLHGVRLQVEPGRGLFTDTGVHLARVVGIKRTNAHEPWVWIGTDTTLLNLHEIPFLQGAFPYVVANRADASPSLVADIVGITCMVDRIVPQAILPAAISVGDVIAFLGTGAYQEAGTGNFNALSRPATVLVSGTSAELIRQRETVDDVFGRDHVPSRLGKAGAALEA